MSSSHTQNPVLHAAGDSLKASGSQTSGMTRANALSDVSDLLNASRMTAAPHSSSAIHHHGDQDTIIFAHSGRGGSVVSDGGKKVQRVEPGDFVLIPAWAEHQEVNDGDEEVVWCIVRSGRQAKVENLEKGWGSS